MVRRIIHAILFGNIYVALGAALLVQSSRVQLGYTDRLIPYSALVFFATLFIYNVQRIFYKPQADKSLHSVRRQWIFRNQGIVRMLAGCGAAGVLICCSRVDPRVILYLLPLLLLSIAYFIPGIRLRKNAWFKLFTLVSVWTVVTAVVPVLLGPEQLATPAHVIHICLRFCFMLGICLPFDMRDISIDSADNVSTVPQILGVRTTRWLAVFFMFLYILLIIPEYAIGMISGAVFLALLISAAINAVMVFQSAPDRSEYFYVAGIDGTMILQGSLVLACSVF
jgi:4-hydroxybenzoate polyprenyltransferase